MKLNQHAEGIWTIERFLSKEDCNNMIIFSEHKGYSEAEVTLNGGTKMMKGIRNNDRLIIEDVSLAERLWNKLKDDCPNPIVGEQAIGLNECFRFYRYESGQRFKRHIDGRFRRNDVEESRISLLIYLSENFEGGATQFDNFIVQPKIGEALLFIHEQKHESTPIESGVKYVLRSDVMFTKTTG